MADCLSQLLGRCCCHETGESCWQEQRVLAVQGQTAYTPAGPVQLSQGNNPRPGQMVVFSDGQAAGSTPQHRSKMRPTTTDGLLPTAAESYASAQRPNNFGLAHLPDNNENDLPKLWPETGQARRATVAISDDGVRHEILAAAGCVDHKDRVIRFPAFYDAVDAVPLRNPPEYAIYTPGHDWERMSVRFDDNGQRGFGQATVTDVDASSGVNMVWPLTAERVWHYKDGRISGGAQSVVTTFRAAKKIEMKVYATQGLIGEQTTVELEVRGYRYEVYKVPRLDPDPDTHHTPMYDANGRAMYEVRETLKVGLIYKNELIWVPVSDAPGGVPGNYLVNDEGVMVDLPGMYPYDPEILYGLPIASEEPVYSAVFSGFVWTPINILFPLPAELALYPFRWRSPDGRIVVTGSPVYDVQELSFGNVLSWPGGRVDVGDGDAGSWGGFRTRGGVALLIHQPEKRPPTVTRVDLPDGGVGRVTTATQADFEAGVMQGQKMYGLGLAGMLMNTWPPQHALVHTGQGSVDT